MVMAKLTMKPYYHEVNAAILSHCYYLGGVYDRRKDKKNSFIAYLNQFIVRDVVQVFRKEWSRMSQIHLEDIYSGIYDGNETRTSKEFLDYEMETDRENARRRHEKELVQDILEMSNRIEKRIMELIMAGYSISQISKATGIKRSTIYDMLGKVRRRIFGHSRHHREDF